MKRFLILIAGALLFAIHANSQNHQGLDRTFGTDGLALIKFQNNSTSGTALALQPDGKIISGGNSSGGALVIRYNADGTPDQSFGSYGAFNTPSLEEINDIIVLQDGKILIAGCGIMRLMPNGSVDHSFGTTGQLDPPICVDQMTMLPDSKILISGNANVAGTDRRVLMRYLPDGALDSTFGNNGSTATDFQYDDCKGLALMPDGRIVVGGSGDDTARPPTYPADIFITCHLPTGELDTTFNHTGTKNYTNHTILRGDAMTLQPDGKVLVASDAVDTTYIIRFNLNGQLDSTFGVYGEFSFTPTSFSTRCLALLPDGRILLGGDNDTHFILVRVKADGSSLDSTFGRDGMIMTSAIGRGVNWLGSILLQPDGKIVGVGEAADNMTTVRYLADAPTAIAAAPAASPVRFTIFPNPATTIAALTASPEFISDAELIAADGKVVRQFHFTPAHSTELALQGIPTGLYTLRCHFFGTSQAAAQSLLIR